MIHLQIVKAFLAFISLALHRSNVVHLAKSLISSILITFTPELKCGSQCLNAGEYKVHNFWMVEINRIGV
jgi:hypothetical protein